MTVARVGGSKFATSREVALSVRLKGCADETLQPILVADNDERFLFDSGLQMIL